MIFAIGLLMLIAGAICAVFSSVDYTPGAGDFGQQLGLFFLSLFFFGISLILFIMGFFMRIRASKNKKGGKSA